MIAALFKFTKLPQWAMDLLALVIVAFLVWFWQHERYEAGIKEQVQTDAAAKANLIRQTDQQTAALQARATAGGD